MRHSPSNDVGSFSLHHGGRHLVGQGRVYRFTQPSPAITIHGLTGSSGANMHNAIFRALIRDGGAMLAALAVIEGEKARFFIVEKRESQDDFIGRVSGWIKANGGTGIDMQTPDIVPKGADVGEVLMRLRAAMGVDRSAGDASEFDVKNTKIALSDAIKQN
jgi:hypothetical protein